MLIITRFAPSSNPKFGELNLKVRKKRSLFYGADAEFCIIAFTFFGHSRWPLIMAVRNGRKENATVGTTEFTTSCTLYYYIRRRKILG